MKSLAITLFVATVLKLLVAMLFAFIGFYYTKNARKLSRRIYESTQHLKPPLSWIFPSRVYKSNYFVVTMWLGGFGAFLGSVIIVATIVLDWVRGGP
jgi:hypothetical protein